MSEAEQSPEPEDRRVPVLVFHGICPTTCAARESYAMPAARFDEMMTLIGDLGYTSISSYDYSFFLLRQGRHLPKKPILITFDDGRADGYLGADPILERHGMRAVGFLITAYISEKRGYYMSWNDVTEAALSNRWDFQLHAHAGHTNVPVGPPTSDGTSPEGPAYAWREWLASDRRTETRDEWRARVIADLEEGERILGERLPLFLPMLFAVPFGDYGEYQTNDGQIQHAMRWELDHRFLAWFTQEKADPDFTVPFRHAEQHRLLMDATMSTEALRSWLVRHEH